jgi:glycerol uptake facilitator-like aquaporin
MATKKATTSPKKAASKTTVKSVKTTTVAKKRFSFKYAPLASAGIAEFIGAFLLTASIFAVAGQPLFVAFALVGLVILLGVFSGAHLNPAITFAAWITRKVSSVRALVYVVVQVVGALAAYLVVTSFLRGTVDPESTTATLQSVFHAAGVPEGKEWYIFAAEALGTAILGFGVATALREKKEKIAAATAVGFGLLIGLLVAGSATAIFLTEGSTTLTFLNPAVAAAANGIAFETWSLAIYIIAPALGASLAFMLHDILSANTKTA